MSKEQDDKDMEAAVEIVAEMLTRQGYASVLVKDGRMWLFTRNWMQSLLDKNPEQDEFHVLIQDRKFSN